MHRLVAAHEAHGSMPGHVLAGIGAELGVAERSVRTSYGIYIRQLGERIDYEVRADDEPLIADAGSFLEAYARLRDRGPLPPFPIVERALWGTTSIGLRRLRTTERVRRQIAAEAGTCERCFAQHQLAA